VDAGGKEDPREHTIYRGCTRPPTFMGVPVMVFVISVIGFALPGFWVMPFNGMVSVVIWAAYVPIFVAMRLASRRDPYTLMHLYQRVTRRLRFGNRAVWGALTYGPLRFDQ